MDEKEAELEPEVGQFPDESKSEPPKPSKAQSRDAQAIVDMYAPYLVHQQLKTSFQLMQRGAVDKEPDFNESDNLEQTKSIEVRKRLAREDRREAHEIFKAFRPTMVKEKAQEITHNITGEISPELAQRFELITSKKKLSE